MSSKQTHYILRVTSEDQVENVEQTPTCNIFCFPRKVPETREWIVKHIFDDVIGKTHGCLLDVIVGCVVAIYIVSDDSSDILKNIHEKLVPHNIKMQIGSNNTYKFLDDNKEIMNVTIR